MPHAVVTAAIFLAALACYAFGLYIGAVVLLAAGGCFELCFWKRAFPGFGVLSRSRPHKTNMG